MTELFSENIDYIFFCSGLAFIILAAVCASLQRAEREQLPWKILGFFGLLHGIAEWSEMAAIGFDAPVLRSAASILSAASFLFLMEFARAGGIRLRRTGPGRPLLLLPLLAVTAAGVVGGWAGMTTVARYVLGFPAWLWAAATLARHGRGRVGNPRLLLHAASLLAILCAFAAGLVVPPAPFVPASDLNAAEFLRLTGVPIELVRALLATGLAFLLYAYSEFPLLESPKRQPISAHYRKLHRAFAIAIGLFLVAGWVGTGRLDRYALDEVNRSGQAQITTLENQLRVALLEPVRTVRLLASSPEVIAALGKGPEARSERIHAALERYREATGAAVCYLLDRRGIAIASSNRSRPDSFVGRSYAFRPYFLSAAGGVPAVQFALGVTSGERGYYASHPVRDSGGEIAGVAVVKQGTDRIEKEFPASRPVFLVSPEGVVFLGSLRDTLLKGLWPLAADEARRIVAGRQFGEGPFPALLPREPADREQTTFQGRPFLVMRRPVNQAGWSLVYLEGTERVRHYRFIGILLTLTFCLLMIGVSIFFRSSLESTAQISISEGRFRAIFENAPGAILIADAGDHRILQFNRFLNQWLQYTEEELLGMSLEDFRVGGKEGEGNRYRKRDGTLVDVEETWTRVPFQKGEALLIVAHDISDHKEREALLREESIRDGLTGLANRRHFDEYLEREWKRALREKSPLSIIICDIDFFKNYNDTYGHQAGDDCLKAVARVLEQGLRRPLDIAARYGGEEFVIVAPGTPLEGALAVAESIRHDTEKLAIPHASSSVAAVVTISLGVACVVPETGTGSADLVAAADQALYRAKEGGRNRTVAS